ncbi:MAG: geranylgeranylglycerol-phosphate geranylgeranyltransferase [Flavobacteriales bacterium]|nr:geranylgeranylglycerol-phosphate geranylgeranyltransferase [Flavobacteriales bacterium]
MIDLLRLTRPLNLLIIAATMAVIRYGVVASIVSAMGLQLQFPRLDFLLLVLSTVLIAAGGNVINDYFDTRIDRINRPGSVIVGRSVKRRVAMAGHLVLSGLGLLLGAALVWHTRLWHLIAIPLFAIAALWTYSSSLKRRLIVGNLVVAVLTALVPLTVGLYEVAHLKRAYELGIGALVLNRDTFAFYLQVIRYWVGAFAAFAFLGTLVRELQKDMADVDGDAALGCRTVPIVMGMGTARALVIVHVLIMVTALLVLRAVFLGDTISFWSIGAIIVTLLLSAGLTYAARDRAGHLRAGNIMKVAMVLALTYGVLLRVIIHGQ